MKRMLVQYKVKPEKAAENQQFIEHVFAELRAHAPRAFATSLSRAVMVSASYIWSLSRQRPARIHWISPPRFRHFRRGWANASLSSPPSPRSMRSGRIGFSTPDGLLDG